MFCLKKRTKYVIPYRDGKCYHTPRERWYHQHHSHAHYQGVHIVHPVGKKQHTVAKTVALYRTTQAPREAVNRFAKGIWGITTEFPLDNRCTYSEILCYADETEYDIV